MVESALEDISHRGCAPDIGSGKQFSVQKANQTKQAAQGLYAGHSYVLYELAIFPGFEVHQWNIQLQNLFPILYVSAIAIET